MLRARGPISGAIRSPLAQLQVALTEPSLSFRGGAGYLNLTPTDGFLNAPVAFKSLDALCLYWSANYYNDLGGLVGCADALAFATVSQSLAVAVFIYPTFPPQPGPANEVILYTLPSYAATGSPACFSLFVAALQGGWAPRPGPVFSASSAKTAGVMYLAVMPDSRMVPSFASCMSYIPLMPTSTNFPNLKVGAYL